MSEQFSCTCWYNKEGLGTTKGVKKVHFTKACIKLSFEKNMMSRVRALTSLHFGSSFVVGRAAQLSRLVLVTVAECAVPAG